MNGDNCPSRCFLSRDGCIVRVTRLDVSPIRVMFMFSLVTMLTFVSRNLEDAPNFREIRARLA